MRVECILFCFLSSLGLACDQPEFSETNFLADKAEPVPSGEWPAVAGLENCTGVLIAPNKVLTAAHCLVFPILHSAPSQAAAREQLDYLADTRGGSQVFSREDRILATINALPTMRKLLEERKGGPAEIKLNHSFPGDVLSKSYKVAGYNLPKGAPEKAFAGLKKCYVSELNHEKCESGQYLAPDFAILTLAEDAAENPIPILTEEEFVEIAKIGVVGKSVGFGAAPVDGTKRQTNAEISNTCKEEASCEEEAEFTVAFPKNISGCGGDSGGPFFVETDAGWRVAGVAARVVKLDSTTVPGFTCNSELIYTRAYTALPLVEEDEVEKSADPPQ